MQWRLIALLRTKWKGPLDKPFIPAIVTSMPSLIDLAHEPHVMLEVPAQQHQDMQIICSQEQVAPCTISLVIHEHAMCSITVLQPSFLPTHVTCTVMLVGEFATCDVVIRTVTAGEKQVFMKMVVTHQAPCTSSTFDLKGVAYGASRFNFEGRVLLEASAHHAQATMHHKHLVVGACARVASQPQLEALHHTVQCGHGSAISYVDEEQLFSITSKGLSEDKAQALIIDSFLS